MWLPWKRHEHSLTSWRPTRLADYLALRINPRSTAYAIARCSRSSLLQAFGSQKLSTLDIATFPLTAEFSDASEKEIRKDKYHFRNQPRTPSNATYLPSSHHAKLPRMLFSLIEVSPSRVNSHGPSSKTMHIEQAFRTTSNLPHYLFSHHWHSKRIATNIHNKTVIISRAICPFQPFLNFNVGV